MDTIPTGTTVIELAAKGRSIIAEIAEWFAGPLPFDAVVVNPGMLYPTGIEGPVAACVASGTIEVAPHSVVPYDRIGVHWAETLDRPMDAMSVRSGCLVAILEAIGVRIAGIRAAGGTGPVLVVVCRPRPAAPGDQALPPGMRPECVWSDPINMEHPEVRPLQHYMATLFVGVVAAVEG